MVSKIFSFLTAASLLASGVSSYALPKAAPVDIITATASPTTASTPTSTSKGSGVQSTITSTAICLTETQNGIVSTRWITATFWAPVIPTSISVITGSGTQSVTVITPSPTTTWTPPSTATTRDPWCTIKVPSSGGGSAVAKRVLPKEEAVKVVKEILEKRSAYPGYFQADTSNKNLGQADMLYCPG